MRAQAAAFSIDNAFVKRNWLASPVDWNKQKDKLIKVYLYHIPYYVVYLRQKDLFHLSVYSLIKTVTLHASPLQGAVY